MEPSLTGRVSLGSSLLDMLGAAIVKLIGEDADPGVRTLRCLSKKLSRSRKTRQFPLERYARLVSLPPRSRQETELQVAGGAFPAIHAGILLVSEAGSASLAFVA